MLTIFYLLFSKLSRGIVNATAQQFPTEMPQVRLQQKFSLFPLRKRKMNKKGGKKFFDYCSNSYHFTNDPTFLMAVQRNIEYVRISGIKGNIMLRDIIRLRIQSFPFMQKKIFSLLPSFHPSFSLFHLRNGESMIKAN